MSLAASLLTLLMLAQSPSAGVPEFRADETLAIPGWPEVAIFRSVAGEVVSLRLSVLLREERGEAGAGQFIQIQAEDRMRSLAERIGARAEVHRTLQALVYQVSGPVADVDFLGWILRDGIRPPSTLDFESARRRARLQNDRRLETPRGVLAARIRAAMVPETPSVYGTTGSLSRIDPARLAAIWERSHRKENARLVVVGRVSTELVLALLNDLGIPDGQLRDPLPPVERTGSPEPSPEVIRHWVVEGYRLPSGDEAAALVVGRWLAEYSRTSGEDFEVGVEIWDVGDNRALVVTAAAYPRSRQAMENRLASLFQNTASLITEDDVTRLSQELRTEIIMAGRTPWGLAELVGQAWDAGNGPEGVESLVSELDRLSRAQVTELVEALARGTAVREELRP